MEITGADLFVKALRQEQVTVLFGYPGGQAIDLFDALYEQDDIEVILPRHEQGLIHAADGYARSTGKTGVCLVTSGPGATNLVTGIATANCDGIPLVCFTGQVSTNLIGKNAFQEVDTVGIVKSICKYAVTVRNRKTLGAIIKKAFFIARTGKPGVVVVDLPKDIQRAYGHADYPKKLSIRGYSANYAPPLGQVQKAAQALTQAKRPLFLIGGGVYTAQAVSEMQQLMEQTGIPAVTTIMGKGTVSTSHPLYIGNVGIHGSFAANNAISQCDVLCAVGTRFNDRITGKTSEFAKDAVVIHIDIDLAAISKNITADLPIVADARQALVSLLKLMLPLQTDAWRKQIDTWKQEHPLLTAKSGLTPQKILLAINEAFTDCIVVTDVGQNQLWTTQFLELDGSKRMLTSGGLGTMGFGLPAALGAHLGNPERKVLAISGDGGIQMNIQELATAVVYEMPIIVCILNNGYLGNVRQWQELFYEKRYSSTCLRRRKHCAKDCRAPAAGCPEYTPDFIRLAESYGAAGIRVTHEDEVMPAFQAAKCRRNGPTVIEFLVQPEENVLPIVPAGKPINQMILPRKAEEHS